MARKFLMTWVPDRRGWLKWHRGKMHSISCKQLGCEPTKEASWEAANEWWQKKQAELEVAAHHSGEEDEEAVKDRQALNTFRLSCLLEDWEQMDRPTRFAIVQAILGKEQADALYGEKKMQQLAEAVDALIEPVSQDHTIGYHVKEWDMVLQARVAARQIDVSRHDAYLRNIAVFEQWFGTQTAIDRIDAQKLESFYTHLCLKVSEAVYSPSYAHSIFGATKQFISRLAELGLILLPGNIRSRKFRFGNGPKKVETFTAAEVTRLLAGCDGFSERTKLYLLLMLNCGMYQSDIADIGTDEVDWDEGVLTRSRSKTPNGPVVRYKLWPETFDLLRKYRDRETVLNDRGAPRVLLTERRKPLVEYTLNDGKLHRHDVVQSAWERLNKRIGGERKPLKRLRKTSSTLLSEHKSYKFYAQYFLAQSPRTVAEKHYVVPSNEEFFEALDWLRARIIP